MLNQRTLITALLTIATISVAAQNQQPPPTATPNPNPPSQVAPVGRRASPPQPQQRQGIEYLEGTWNFIWTGRESAFSPGPRSGAAMFARQGTSNVLNLSIDGRVDGGAAFKESGTYTWDDAAKAFAISEKLAAGPQIQGKGDWSSPLSIRFESQPVQVQGQSFRLRRTYSILSSVAFSVVEEMSTNGGPFQRIGNGEFTRK